MRCKVCCRVVKHPAKKTKALPSLNRYCQKESNVELHVPRHFFT